MSIRVKFNFFVIFTVTRAVCIDFYSLGYVIDSDKYDYALSWIIVTSTVQYSTEDNEV